MHPRSNKCLARVKNGTMLPISARGEPQNDSVGGNAQFQLGDDDFYQVANVSISGNIYYHRLATA